MDEIEPCNAELIQGLQSLCSSTKVKPATNQGAAAALFRKQVGHNSEGSMRQHGSSSSRSPKWNHEDGNEIVIGNETLKQIFYEKQTLGNGPPILSNLAGRLKNFGPRVLGMIKPLEVFGMWRKTAVIEFDWIYLYSRITLDSKHPYQKIIEICVTKTFHTPNYCLVITSMIAECKDRFKASLSKDYKIICDQDHSDSKLLLGGGLDEIIRRGKASYSPNQSISENKIRTSSATPSRSSIANCLFKLPRHEKECCSPNRSVKVFTQEDTRSLSETQLDMSNLKSRLTQKVNLFLEVLLLPGFLNDKKLTSDTVILNHKNLA